MDFDLSKENIQPLRGGRNVTQLEVALQAQSDSELQKELLQQKESFEEAIRNYEGDDPLENWYNYIYWVEQSYPKHGHEGNLVPLLEDCLSKFENEEKYIHDRRLCKLWIKYIDAQQNSLELFQLLHSKGICVSCADLYRAWAYYHEVAGDHKRADAVFELGIRVLAQPYEDLVSARNNMYTAIGKQAITGVDERRLVEQRHALTSLRPYIQRRTTMVANVRTGTQVVASNTPGVLQQNLLMSDRRSNVPVTLYEDQAVAGPSVGGADSVISILDVARRQEVVHKENALKPGPWNTKKSIIGSRVSQQRALGFKIHEDDEPAKAEGICLPPDFAPMNHDDFSTWDTPLFFPEPPNSSHIPMYPKSLVYAEPNCEYSLEEIRARKWFAQRQSDVAAVATVNASINMQETIMEDANIMSSNQQTSVDISIPSTSNSINQSIPSNFISQPQTSTQSYPVSRPSVLSKNTSIHQQHALQNSSSSSASSNQHLQTSFNVSAHVVEHYQPSELQQRVTIYENNQHSQIGEGSNSQGHVENYNLKPVNQSLNLSSQNYVAQKHRNEAQYQNVGQNAGYINLQNFITENNAQSFRQSSQYRQPVQISDAQDHSLRQQSLHHYSMQSGHSSGQSTQNCNSIAKNQSLLQNSSQYQQQLQNYPSVSQTSNPNLRQSIAGQNVVIHQDEPSNNSAETFVPRQSYSIQSTMAKQPYSAQTTVPVYQDPIAKNILTNAWQNNTLSSDDNYTANMREAIKDINDIWKDNLSTLQEPIIEVKKPEVTKFKIHEDTNFLQDDASESRKPIVKATPFAIFSDDVAPSSSGLRKSDRKLQEISPVDSNEHCAGSSSINEMHNNSMANSIPTHELQFSIYEEPTGRHSRAPFLSQPLPDSKSSLTKCISHSQPSSDNFTRPAEMRKSTAFPVCQDNVTAATSTFNDTCTTQMFNFNLNSLHAHSTPFNSKKTATLQQRHYPNATIFGNEEEEAEDLTHGVSKKVLFHVHEEEKEKSDQSLIPQEETRMQEKLSIILETTKEYRSSSSSSSGGTTLKTTTFNFRESLKVIPETSIQSNSESGLELKTNNAAENSNENCEEGTDSEKSTNNDYSMIKDLLRSGEDNGQKYRSSVIIMDGYNDESPSYLPINQVIHQDNHIIDLTDDDSDKARKSHYLMRFSEVGSPGRAGINTQSQNHQSFNNSKLQKSNLMPSQGKESSDFEKNFESPVKNQCRTFESPNKNQFKGFASPVKNFQFYESSNDSMSCSPMKGSRMEVDAILQTQNSNSEFKMDYDSYQEAPTGYMTEDLILNKVPSDPFSSVLINALLNKVGFPNAKYSKQYIKVNGLPRINKKGVGKKEIVCLGDEKYLVEKVIGKGSFGTVYKAVNESTNAMVALKYQKPANKWELYICKEIQERLTNPYLVTAFMDVSICYVSQYASMLVSEYFKLGSLLDLMNKVKQVTGKGVKELVAIYYANEIITIVNALHQCQIIHADIKPDNFLVTCLPPKYGHPSLQLIDFGCSIDMSLFPEGTTFTKSINTENFTCTEMKDGRPWTYQTDMFCIAATVHVLLFEKYLQLQKRGDVWSISQNMPRYMRKDLWNTFFFQMLNIDGCDKLPDLNSIKASFESILSAQSEDLQIDMRFVANSIYGR